MNRKLTLAAVLFVAMLFSGNVGVQFVGSARGNPEEPASVTLAMPEEYVNYTVARVSGTLWAKIDGFYPISILSTPDNAIQCNVIDKLFMVYPTPPGTTNITIRLNGTEFPWSNYTEAYPHELHHTAIGDWPMVSALIGPVSESFLLTIHYEHPITSVNGSYLFLYDLNISPYLSPISNSSKAVFTIVFETEVTDIRAYTTKSDSVWIEKNYTEIDKTEARTLRIFMNSFFNEPLDGDLVVMFSDYADQDSTDVWLLVVILGLLVSIGSLIALVLRNRRRT